MPKDSEIIVIKKYPNRRLYNTQISNYVTLDDLYHMVKKDEDFIVLDVKTGEDLTGLTLTQIILDRETKGNNLLPNKFLRQIISLYDNNLNIFIPKYLETFTMAFNAHKDKLTEISSSYRANQFDVLPLKQFEEITRQNMAFFENTLKFFSEGFAPKKKD